jgi:hypothetical protein
MPPKNVLFRAKLGGLGIGPFSLYKTTHYALFWAILGGEVGIGGGGIASYINCLKIIFINFYLNFRYSLDYIYIHLYIL